MTVKDAYGLRIIDGLLILLSDNHYVIAIDLEDVFWQIPLEESSRDKTAFYVPGRPLYQFTVIPFGLCQQTMRNLIDKVIPHQLHGWVFVYLEHLLIIFSNPEEKFTRLLEVSEGLKKKNLTINVKVS